MASTLVEATRSAHEEVERLELLIVQCLEDDDPLTSRRDRLIRNHRVRQMIDSITSTTNRLIDTYEDKDNARKEEIASLGTDVFSAFYGRLKEICEYHRKHPASHDANAGYDQYEALPVIKFTGEEGFGRYLDLHALYNQYINSKFGKPIDYSAYLDAFSQMQNIPLKLKSARQYRKYMENLLEYLMDFFRRIEPLQDVDRIFSKLLVQDNNYPDIALMEAKINKLCHLLSKTIEETKQNIVKRQALICKEMERDRMEEEEEEETTQFDTENDGEEQPVVYNPLKLPMGWDGKPIPFWLYKLHGLDQEFKCEICRGSSYWGRRAFERHFQESRHQRGMRQLGIPYTKDFNEIRSIEEALALWNILQQRKAQNNWCQDLEEFEDRDGNIYHKKIYVDLQCQGLV
ncbi:hypothetical protein SLE2022_263480 [Rubroshorea leprosula]